MANVFVDGEPIDASKLQELRTELNKLRSEMPTFGSGSTKVSIGGDIVNQTVVNSGPEIRAGNAGKVVLSKAGEIVVTVNFNPPFSKTPTVVVCPVRENSSNGIVVSVVPNSTGTTQFKALVYSPAARTFGLNYIAIAY